MVNKDKIYYFKFIDFNEIHENLTKSEINQLALKIVQKAKQNGQNISFNFIVEEIEFGIELQKSCW